MALLSLSLQAVYDGPGNRVFDARLAVSAAGTNIPAAVYADAGYNTALPNPVLLRGNGTWPVIYAAPGSYRLRITDAFGFIYDEIDGLTVQDEAAGGGGGGSVDDKRLNQTGDIKDRYGTGTHPGWVRGNGRTIGSSASSATERANADCEALFLFLWTQDPNLAVSGGRGANAASDWAAGKTIALPDFRGRGRFSLDDMGATAAGRLTGGLFTFGNATTLGSYGGEASHVQTLAELASHDHAATGTMLSAGTHNHTGTTNGAGAHLHEIPYRALNIYRTDGGITQAVTSVGAADPNFTGYTSTANDHTHLFTTASAGGHTHAMTVSVSARGSSAAMNWLPPFVLVSTYLKL